MLPENFSNQVIELLVDWLWRSWNAAGVQGQGSLARADRVIDPEVLLLASTCWARHDPRLFDEMLDWLCLHGELINLQRLKNLHRTGLGDTKVLGLVADVIREHSGQGKWRTLAVKSARMKPPEPLFINASGGTTPSWGVREPLFASHGFDRGRLELRQMSQPPSPALASNLWFKLRMLFGTTSRAEVMVQLLAIGPGTAAGIARRSQFTPRSILITLREMALSGHIDEPPRPSRQRPARGLPVAPRTRGPSLAYSLRTEDWGFLRTWEEPAGFPQFKPAAPLLLLCQRFLAWAAGRDDKSSSDIQSMRLREAVTPCLEEIQRHGLAGDYGLPSKRHGESLVHALVERLPLAIASL